MGINGIYATIKNLEPGSGYKIKVAAVGKAKHHLGKLSEPLEVFTG